ncbi:Alpha- and gamma-adaptin-binding p34 [Brachionus plicatilis]|uniref:Alpha-and gamma-adaptin-binding p34 n=1 Tax=Brachionus plicatilis TaxID=10195 RepID=A0A3M7Q4G0_BRAPC|nr:Alpha- and gamma-adaptin-binding p34 [Brachionus plicatilis]
MAQVDMVSRKNVSVLCFGEKNECEHFFKKIQNYDSSINKIYLNETELNIYSFRLDTKYYDLDLVLEFVPFEPNCDRVRSIASDEPFLNNIQSIFILVNNKNYQFIGQLDQLVNKLENMNESNSCLSILILTEETKIPLILSKRYENFLKIKLNGEKNLLDESEDSFLDFDEMINGILVHSWEGIELKSDKKVMKKFEKIDTEMNDSEFDDKNFNLENLMMNLKDIREKSKNMDFEERKKFAENVTLNFWKSVGGEPDEIDGLDDKK